MKFVLLISTLFSLLSSCHEKTSDTIGINTSKSTTTDILNSDKPINEYTGIIYFSTDNGNTWEDKSQGLPENINLTDLAVSEKLLGAATKQHGIFLYDFNKNIWTNTEGKPHLTSNIDALIFHDNKMFAGTENAGVLISADQGKTWLALNEDLGNLTIRKFAIVHHKLYAGTNGGLYSFNEKEYKWTFEYGQNSLQVNGITEFDDEIYIGTNQGAFKSLMEHKNWKQVIANGSLYNISSDDRMVYAMTYDNLRQSIDRGNTWQILQKGLPAQLYTFQVLKKDSIVFAGQWDGVYKMKSSDQFPIENAEWEFSGNGLPGEFAVTEMKAYKNILIIGCSERRLNKGMTTDR